MIKVGELISWIMFKDISIHFAPVMVHSLQEAGVSESFITGFSVHKLPLGS